MQRHHHAHPDPGPHAPRAGGTAHRPAHYPGGVLPGQGAGVQRGGRALRRRADGAHQGRHRYVAVGISGLRQAFRHRHGGYLRGLRPAGSAGGGNLYPFCRVGRAGCGQPRLYGKTAGAVPQGHRRGGSKARTAVCHTPLCQLRRRGVVPGDIYGHGASRHFAVRLRRPGGEAGAAPGDGAQDHSEHHQDL